LNQSSKAIVLSVKARGFEVLSEWVFTQPSTLFYYYRQTIMTNEVTTGMTESKEQSSESNTAKEVIPVTADLVNGLSEQDKTKVLEQRNDWLERQRVTDAVLLKRQYAKAYRVRHREQLIEKARLWREAHRAKVRAYGQKYLLAHKEVVRERHRIWDATHKEECLEKDKRYRETHRELLREKQRLWREANKEACRECQRRYYDLHKEQVNATKKLWREANRDKIRAYQRKYVARRKELLAKAQGNSVAKL
jgi:hypothetical protein